MSRLLDERRKEYQKKYRDRPENKAKMKEYQSRPDVKKRHKDSMREYRGRPDVKARLKKYFARPEFRTRRMERRLKLLYGISLHDWKTLFAKQGKRCAICKTSTARQWHTDHCHKTGVVRGILCRKCNIGLGHVEDRVEVLKQMIIYLTAHGRSC